MSGFTDIDGSTLMLGSPGIEDCAEMLLDHHDISDEYGVTPLRRMAALTSDVPVVQAIFDRAKAALALAEAREWDKAIDTFQGPHWRRRNGVRL